MKKKSILLFLSILSIFLSLSPTIAKAEESIDFTVKPQITGSQIGDNNSYFNLRTSSEKKEELPIKITNYANKTSEYIVSVNSATTNMNGIVDYSQPSVKSIESKQQFSDLVEKREQTISIASGEEKVIYIALTAPKNSFDGVILGGITIAKKQDDKDDSKKMIKNEFQYAIAVQLSENDQDITPNLQGGPVQLTQINKRNAVQMLVKNPQPKVMKQVEGTFTITKKGQKTAIVQEKRNGMSFAPNSEFSLFTMLNDKFKSGEYTYTIKLVNAEGTWTFSEDFSIDQKEANTLNKKSVDEAPEHSSWLYIIVIMGIVILILLLILGYTLWKFQQVKKEQ
ncbi:hypothetical protein ATZ33_13595 [Enterococcus silesiacus]|uniref:Uncharacterized protein n=1 Tax=Enterococcus silesiacus TaxID=332949 RepID=A0A0S3KDQ6_9ENTE|nr:DUF916 and DUF3324 domain-containing protein [Enterococcus silesiacus]ALS02382.1 hypothetical protein ATZ33_13595 [Enterococcus silesiacus]OJG91358.1 hypothetical protein RV15_GL000814 [Enterococcus silesiacus]